MAEENTIYIDKLSTLNFTVILCLLVLEWREIAIGKQTAICISLEMLNANIWICNRNNS